MPVSGAQNTSCILPGIYVGAGDRRARRRPALARAAAVPDRWARDDGAGRHRRRRCGSPAATSTRKTTRRPSSTSKAPPRRPAMSNPFDAEPSRSAPTASDQRRRPTRPAPHPICKQRIVSPIPDRSSPLQTDGSAAPAHRSRGCCSSTSTSRRSPALGRRLLRFTDDVDPNGSAEREPLQQPARPRGGLYALRVGRPC